VCLRLPPRDATNGAAIPHPCNRSVPAAAGGLNREVNSMCVVCVETATGIAGALAVISPKLRTFYLRWKLQRRTYEVVNG
jgi:hypothetical protein